MANPLDLDLLKTLVAVAETGSFSLAAQRVSRSQSAVSMQIQKLEASLGKVLLQRDTKTIMPTAAGTDLIAYARRLLKISDEAWASITHPDETGTVRLGIPEDYSTSLLPNILEQFAQDHPRVTVDLVCEPTLSLTQAIKDDRIDLAVVTRLAEYPAEVLRREPMVWVSSPRHEVWKSDPLPVALFQTCAARVNILKALADAERPFRCTYSSASLTGMITIVQAGLAVAGLARCSVPPSLKIVGEAEGLPAIQDLEVGLLRNDRATASSVQRLYDVLRRELRSERGNANTISAT